MSSQLVTATTVADPPTPAAPIHNPLPALPTVGIHNLLPALLSAIAGMVDVIGFLSLGLFTAHVTGNLVVIAALVVRGGPPKVAQILALPVFMGGVAAVWLIAKVTGRRGPRLTSILLQVQFLLLACVLVFAVTFDPAVNPHGMMGVIAALLAVSAMGCQFGLLHLAVPGAPSTGVMTGNLTNGVLALLDALLARDQRNKGAEARLKKSAELLAGFCGGCIVGGAAVGWLGPWAWALPVALAGLAVRYSRRQSAGHSG